MVAEAGVLITIENMLYKKNAAKKDEKTRQGDGSYSYKDILEKISQLITENHSTELASVLYDKSAEQRLRSLISRYIIQEKLRKTGEDITELASIIYEDMAGISFVKYYLDDPEVEEININGPDCIWVSYPDHKEIIDRHFNSTEECINIVKKMARMGNLILDAADPYGDSFIRKGIRMSASIYPVVSEEVGAVCSIRKQKPSYITREKIIEFGTATAEQLNFLSMCINSGTSIAICGETGSGKTADLNYLLSTVEENTRIYSIEDTKELQLDTFDKRGRRTNDIVQTYTVEGNHPVTMNALLKNALRMHPDIIVPAEMRGGEAIVATKAGHTGHTIISTLHANGAREAYLRIMDMYLEAGTTLSEERVLKMIVEAFPITVFKSQLKDNYRKYMQIFEATGVVNGEVVGNMLYEFVPERTEAKNGVIIKIHGSHKQVGSISDKLASRLRLNGVSEEVIRKYQMKQCRQEAV